MMSAGFNSARNLSSNGTEIAAKATKASQSKPKQAKESKSKQQSQQEFKFKMSSVLRDANTIMPRQTTTGKSKN